MRGRRPSRKALIAALAALAVLGGAGVAALVAASGDDDDPAPVVSAPSASSPGPGPSSRDTTSTAAPDARGGSSSPKPETSETGTAPAPAAPPPEPSGSSGGTGVKNRLVKVPPARVFSGKGTTWLGTIDVGRPAVVRWSGSGRLSIRFGRERFPAVAPSHSGQLAVPPYRFELVRVVSNGSWRIEITPQQ